MDIKNSFSDDDYQLVERKVVYEGVFRMARYCVRYKLFNGGWSKSVWLEVMERMSAVGVLPYDPIADKVVLIEQFRPGPLTHPVNPWLTEIVAGVFHPDEDPKDVALREAKEEANCEILDLYPIYEYFVSPGGCNEYIHIFIGRIDATNAGGIFGLADENEDIRVKILSSDDAFALLQSGGLKTSPAIVSLQWLQLNRERLKQLWQTK